jgi:hypothetical protein
MADVTGIVKVFRHAQIVMDILVIKRNISML